VTEELGQKILNLDSLGLKIVILYSLALSPTSLKILSAVGDGVNKVKDVIAKLLQYLLQKNHESIRREH
jgi:hypothetical protein